MLQHQLVWPIVKCWPLLVFLVTAGWNLLGQATALRSCELPSSTQSSDDQRVAALSAVELEYQPASVANPLKGLVPYSGKKKDLFPHTMEFNYIAYHRLVRGYDDFDWQPLEELLDDVAGRGHQAIFRIYLEYPGQLNILPRFLLDDGLKVHRYINTNTQPHPPQEIETPDYEDRNLRRSLTNFIRALGEKYDGDPRIGFITAGLLGTWGEWHTYPREDLFASKAVQAEILAAYEAAFHKTNVLLRYPVGPDSDDNAANSHRPFGYHDDSFAWATLHTGRRSDDWYYMTVLDQAGALDKWKTQPIGGEIRPEAWGIVFDSQPNNKQVQDFRKCVEATHVSWLMDSGMFRRPVDPERRQRAEQEVRRMGYEFYVPRASLSTGQSELDSDLILNIEIVNRGVAPFYYDWQAEIALLTDDGKVAMVQPAQGKINGILPDQEPVLWRESLDVSGLAAGQYTLALRIANPLENGYPIRFANRTQDADLDGWLSLLQYDRK